MARKGEPDIRWQGGGVPAGGRAHAGHAEWYAQLMSVTGDNFGKQSFIPVPPPMNVIGNGSLPRSAVQRNRFDGYEAGPAESGVNGLIKYAPAIINGSILAAQLLYNNAHLFQAFLRGLRATANNTAQAFINSLNPAAAAVGGAPTRTRAGGRRVAFRGGDDVRVIPARGSSTTGGDDGGWDRIPGTGSATRPYDDGSSSVVTAPHDQAPTSAGVAGRPGPQPRQGNPPPRDLVLPEAAATQTQPGGSGPVSPLGAGSGPPGTLTMEESLMTTAQEMHSVVDGMAGMPGLEPATTFDAANGAREMFAPHPEILPPDAANVLQHALENLIRLRHMPGVASAEDILVTFTVGLLASTLAAAAVGGSGARAMVAMVTILAKVKLPPVAVTEAVAAAGQSMWEVVKLILNPGSPAYNALVSQMTQVGSNLA